MKRASKCLLGAAVLLLFGAAICSANLISYIEPRANKEVLIVMEDDGTNPVELFVARNRDPAIEGPTVSPAGPDESWILFNQQHIYKIPPGGGDPVLVLCIGGTDTFGAPYYCHGAGGRWSPDGSEILFHCHDSVGSHEGSSLALLGANHTADETCASELIRIYEAPLPWGVDGPATWNHDGSQITVLEINSDNEETEEGRLAVIERQASGVWERIHTKELTPGSPDLQDHYPQDLSWQPQAESRLLTFRLRDGVGYWLASVDLDTGVWDYVLDKGGSQVQLGFDSYPRWSSNGEEILFTDQEGNLVRWTYPDGDRQVIGSGFRSDWQRDAVAGVCGDGNCAGSENQCNCALDCGAYPSDEAGLCSDLTDNDCDGPIDCEDSDCKWDEACPFCGDFVCNGDETECSCSVDCGTPPSSEAGLCTDGVDNDCDGDFDCDDPDCSDDQACTSTCGAKGEACATGDDCCSGLCHPVKLECK